MHWGAGPQQAERNINSIITVPKPYLVYSPVLTVQEFSHLNLSQHLKIGKFSEEIHISAFSEK